MSQIRVNAVKDPQPVMRRLATAGRAAATTKLFEEFEVVSVLDGSTTVATFERPTGRVQIVNVTTGAERWFREEPQAVSTEMPPASAGR